MDGSISRVRISDGTFRYRARYRDPSGRQHEQRLPRKVDAQRWPDEATSALVTRTWTAPERGRVTVAGGPDVGSPPRRASSPAPTTGTARCCVPTYSRRGATTGWPT